jgi:hypothetical protein
MFAAMGKAFLVFGPIVALATVLVNVLDASYPLALAIVLTVSGAGSVYAALLDARHQEQREAARRRTHGPADA